MRRGDDEQIGTPTIIRAGPGREPISRTMILSICERYHEVLKGSLFVMKVGDEVLVMLVIVLVGTETVSSDGKPLRL